MLISKGTHQVIWSTYLATASHRQRRLHPSAFILHPSRGQALPLAAIILVALLALLTTAMEVQERYYQRQVIEDALQQATRSAAQSFDYAQFAANRTSFVVETGPATKTGCASAPSGSARAIACVVLLTNLQTAARGLDETAAETAERVHWTIYAEGGTCTFPNGRAPLTDTRPMVCATLQPRMHGLLGWGIWTPQLDAADVLDRSQ